jgi:hypothetical protein
VRVLSNEDPSVVGDGREKIDVFGGLCEMIVVRLDQPPRSSQRGGHAGAEVAVAEED